VRRTLLMLLLLLLVPAVPSAIASSIATHAPRPPMRVSALTHNGAFRCRAEFDQPVLRPGYETGVSFSVTNRTDRRRTISAFGVLEFSDAAGNEVWDTYPEYFGPYFSVRIPAGGTRRIPTFDVRLRWGGPLTIQPECAGLRVDLASRTFDVSVPGPTPRPSDAILAIQPFTGPLTDACAPGARGQDAVGVLDPPPVADPALLPQSVRCWAHVRQEPGFDLVTYFIVTPDTLGRFEMDDRCVFCFFGSRPPANMAAGRWDFVVTADQVRTVFSASGAKTNVSEGRAGSFAVIDGTWHEEGSGSCGYEGIAIWFRGSGFSFDWVNACVDTDRVSRSRPVVTVHDLPAQR
jgi:hypothetical protein